MLQITVAEGETQFETLREEWNALVCISATATPFQTWEWQSTWFRHFGAGARPIFLLAHMDSTLVGIFPLVQVSGPFGIRWKSMGVGPSDYLHPLLASGFESKIFSAFEQFIIGSKKESQVDLHQLRGGPGIRALKPDQAWDQATCLVLELPRSFEEYLKNVSKSLRSDIVRGLKPGDIYCIEESTASNVELIFEQFLMLHRARWRRRGLPGAFFGKNVRFQREWIHLASKKGWLNLTVMKQNDLSIGALYTMQFKDTVYFYQLGIDPTIKGISPGTILIANAIRRAIDGQKMFFDFMRGDEPYKHRWKPNSSYVNHRLLYRRVGVLGTASFKWTTFIWRVECAIRAKVEGKGLL